MASASTSGTQVFRRLLSFSGFRKKFANLAFKDARNLSQRVYPEIDLLPFDLRYRNTF
jgi:hypothetical protein